MKRVVGTVWYVVAFVLGALVLLVSSVVGVASAEESGFDLIVSAAAPQHVAPGGEYVIHVTYANLGNVPTPDDTWVSAALPDGVQFVSAADKTGVALAPDSDTGGLLTWQVGVIPLEECTHHILITVKVADELAEGTALLVPVEAGASGGEVNLDNNHAEALSEVCDLAGSTKQASSDWVRPGDVLTYTIQLRLAYRHTSAGLQQRTVVLTDTLPGGNQVRFLGWNGPVTGEWDGQHLRWQGQVRPGEPLTLQYRVGVEANLAPGSIITNTAYLGFGGMQVRLGPVATHVEMPANAAIIGQQGLRWQADSNLEVAIPPEAVTEMTRFEYQSMFRNGEPVEPPDGHRYANQAFELNAFQYGELHHFGQPLALKLKLSPQEAAELRQQHATLWYRSQSGEAWVRMGEPVWLDDQTIAFSTDHFTQFALFTTKYQLLLPWLSR